MKKLNYQLNTKIISQDNALVDITCLREKTSPRTYDYSIQDNQGVTLGEASVLVFDTSFYIMTIKNLFCGTYKKVGTALHELIFRESIIHGKEGCVDLGSAWGTILFHYACGFRLLHSENLRKLQNSLKYQCRLIDSDQSQPVNYKNYLEWWCQTKSQKNIDYFEDLLNKNLLIWHIDGMLTINNFESENIDLIKEMEEEINTMYQLSNIIDFYYFIFLQSPKETKELLILKLQLLPTIDCYLPPDIIAAKCIENKISLCTDTVKESPKKYFKFFNGITLQESVSNNTTNSPNI